MAREQRLVFGEVAEEYERFRPSYPDALFDTIAELAALEAGDPVLDVGAGTGKVTASLVARGYTVTAVEPSPEMAQVLHARFPDIAVQVCGFEECELRDGSYAAITAGQSWHWVDPGRGVQKARSALRPGGWLALFWNTPRLDGCEWHDELQPVYRRRAPNLEHAVLDPVLTGGVSIHFEMLRTGALFEPPVLRRIPWALRYTTDGYVSLLATHSNHRLLPDDQRAALHADIAEVIDSHGGEIEHPYVTELIAARVK